MDPIIKLVLVPDLSTVVGTADPERVTYWLREVALPGDRSRALARLSADELTALARFAATDDAVELLDSVDDELAARFLRAAEADDAVRLLDALDSDRVADILRELKGAPRQRILDLLPAQRADRIRGLLSWPQDSAAAHMVPEMLTVSPGVTVAEAIAMVRAEANALRTDARTGAYVFIVDDDARLGGVVGFRDLVLAEPETPVDALADTDVRTVNALDDAEDAARALDAYDLVAVPVIDEHGRLLGIVTEDDAADIAEEEATEDAERQGGSSPLDVPYLRASPLLLWRKRIVWLLLLFVALTSAVQWRTSPPEAVSAELWSATPQAAAPRGIALAPRRRLGLDQRRDDASLPPADRSVRLPADPPGRQVLRRQDRPHRRCDQRPRAGAPAPAPASVRQDDQPVDAALLLREAPRGPHGPVRRPRGLALRGRARPLPAPPGCHRGNAPRHKPARAHCAGRW